MNNIDSELAKYLKSKNGFNRLMKELKNKYISLSKFSGTVIVSNLTKEESKDISNLLGRKVDISSTLKTSFKEIEKKINQGKYDGFDWLSVFNCYFNEEIVTKNERKSLEKNDEYEFFNEFYKRNIKSLYINEICEIIKHDKTVSTMIKRKYNRDKEMLRKELDNILLLLDNIPATPTPLAIYSSLTTDPHYLDFNRQTSGLFIRIVGLLKHIEFKNDTETKINILSEINVYTDPLSNYVICYKITGNNVLDRLSDENEIINLNLLNVCRLKKIDTDIKRVFVFENPSILNLLKDLDVPVVITSGIPNIAVYELLKKLVDSGNEIYYNGDFDPEGLIIAQKLKEKIPSMKLFCYDTIDYTNSKSTNKLSESRLKKLDNIVVDELKLMISNIKKNKVGGYQEQNIDRIKEFILGMSSGK